MAYIPEDANWYLAVLVEEIRVEGEGQNIVHKNLVLLRACSPEVAFERAHDIGKKSEISYQNPQGRLVQIKFKGLSELNVIYEKLEDGAELKYEELIGLSEGQVDALLHAKNDLAAFRPITPSKGPDYSSADVLEEAKRLMDGSGPRGTSRS
jgi:hypothetical protein